MHFLPSMKTTPASVSEFAAAASSSGSGCWSLSSPQVLLGGGLDMYSMKLPYVESGSKQSLCRSLGTDATSGLAAADGTGVVVFILAMAFTVCWLDVTKDGLKARIEKKERLAAGRSPQSKIRKAVVRGPVCGLAHSVPLRAKFIVGRVGAVLALPPAGEPSHSGLVSPVQINSFHCVKTAYAGLAWECVRGSRLYAPCPACLPCTFLTILPCMGSKVVHGRGPGGALSDPRLLCGPMAGGGELKTSPILSVET